MITDRYSKAFFDDNSIVIIDADLNYGDTEDDEIFFSTVKSKVMDYDRSVYKNAAEADIGSGADLPVVLFEVAQDYIPFAAATSLFFAGEQIEKQLSAWTRMYSKLMEIMGPLRKVNANGAALIALHAVSKKTRSAALRLKAYLHRDEEVGIDEKNPSRASFSAIRSAKHIEARDAAYRKGTYSDPVFLFKITDGERIFLVRVAGSTCEVIEADDNHPPG